MLDSLAGSTTLQAAIADVTNATRKVERQSRELICTFTQADTPDCGCEMVDVEMVDVSEKSLRDSGRAWNSSSVG